MSPASMLQAIITGYVPTFREIGRHVHTTEGIKGQCATELDLEDDDIEAEPIKPMPPASAYANITSQKEKTIALILDAIAAGHATQPAIEKITGISSGTVSKRCGHLVDTGDIKVNKRSCPWFYWIPRRSK